ncbi:MAG: sigma-70 family RNA polymerase sigma factor [Candidatus Omnitrophica bacterium]|nr:sigma-70 family RNA polymerase sigma factor [Candidatus Omnitrophota bacterium]
MNISGNLDQAVDNKQRETFIFLLKPHLDSLRKIASREIYNLEIKENIRLGAVSIEDLINETILKAWRDYRKKAKAINLDQWLVQILFQIIKQAVEKERKFLGLSDAMKPVPMDDVGVEPDFDSDQWWWSQIEPADDILWEDLLPGEESPESFRQLTQQEENKILMDALSLLPEEDRQIFSLFALDGYDLSEISKITNQPLKKIKDIIEKSKDKIRDLLQK